MLPDETIESTFCNCCQQFCGYNQELIEQSDFRGGTSSRSIKLAHGGVRYLQQGIIEWEDDKMA
jgi:glycerol-3-phosphate dehydrogenase